MSLRSVRSITAVTVMLLSWLFTVEAREQRGVLFSAVSSAELPLDSPKPTSRGATTVRRRVVTMDLRRLRRARAVASELPRRPARIKAVSPHTSGRDAVSESDAILTLNLFDDVVVTGVVEQTAPTFFGGYSLSGRIVGKPHGTVTIVVNGKTVAGTVRTLGGTYRIRSLGGGRYAISEVKEPPLDCKVLKPESE